VQERTCTLCASDAEATMTMTSAADDFCTNSAHFIESSTGLKTCWTWWTREQWPIDYTLYQAFIISVGWFIDPLISLWTRKYGNHRCIATVGLMSWLWYAALISTPIIHCQPNKFQQNRAMHGRVLAIHRFNFVAQTASNLQSLLRISDMLLSSEKKAAQMW